MRDLVQKNIDDRHYEFQQFNTTTALKVLAKITKLIGEPLAIALGSSFKVSPKENMLDKELDTDVLAKAVRALIQRLDEDEVVWLVQKMTAESVLCNNQKIIFDLHYKGEILTHLPKVLKAAFEVQYGNFTDAMIANMPQAKMAQQPIVAR